MDTGFTLIELLFVLAIIAILTSIALPTYQNYLEKAEVMEGFSLATDLQLAVIDAYHETGKAPLDRNAAGLASDKFATAGRYIDSAEIDHGVIRLNFGEHAHTKLKNKILQFTPYLSVDDNIVWRCQHASVDSKFTLMPGAQFTPLPDDLPNTFLPSACRD